MINEQENFEDIDINEVLGMDIEPEDRSVGIFGATFCIVLKTDKGKQIQLNLGEDEMASLVEAIKPYTDEIKSQQEMDKFLK